MNVWMRPCAAGSIAHAARSRSARWQRARHATTGRRISVAILRTASASAGEAIGNPASMMSTPKGVELTSQLQLLGGVERKSRRLLAVPQSRVEDPYVLSCPSDPLERRVCSPPLASRRDRPG